MSTSDTAEIAISDIHIEENTKAVAVATLR